MISIANAVPVLLFVLTLNNGGVYVAGTIGDTPVDMDMDKPRCKSHDFINTALDRCYHSQGLPAIKSPWDPEFLSSIDNFISIEEDMCSTQFLIRVKEAYHCFYNSCSDCYDEFLADPANSVDDDNRRFVQDLELYAPDPDMFGDAIRGICELDEDLSCLDGDKETRLLLCWLGEVQAMLSSLRKDLFNKRSPVKTFKPAMCEMFSGFQRCTTDHLQGCPQKTVSMAGRVVNLLTPLGCHIYGTTGMKQDGERQAESADMHEDL